MWSSGSATQDHASCPGPQLHRHLRVTMPKRAMVTGNHTAYIRALFPKDGEGHSCRDSRSPGGRNPSGLPR